MLYSTQSTPDRYWEFDQLRKRYRLSETNLPNWTNPDDCNSYHMYRELPIFKDAHFLKYFTEINIGSIPYYTDGKEDHLVYIYDPSCFEEEEITAPDISSMRPKEHTGKVVTLQTLIAARKISEKLHQIYYKHEQKMRHESFDFKFWEYSQGRGFALVSSLYDSTESLAESVDPEKYIWLNLNTKRFEDREYPFFRGIVAQKDMLPLSEKEITISLSKPYYFWAKSNPDVGLLIGKKGENAKKIANFLGVHRVNINEDGKDFIISL